MISVQIFGCLNSLFVCVALKHYGQCLSTQNLVCFLFCTQASLHALFALHLVTSAAVLSGISNTSHKDYLFLLSKIIFIGSKYPKIVFIDFEKNFTAGD